VAGKKRALILCPENPYPMQGGGALRTAALVEYLSRHYALDAVVFREAGQAPSGLTEWGRRARRVEWLLLPRHSRHPAARLWRNFLRAWRHVPPLVDRFAGHEAALAGLLRGHSYDVAIIEHFWCAPYLRVIRDHARQVILDLHNIESVWHERCARYSPVLLNVLHRRFAQACRKLEQQWIPQADWVLVTSEPEARRLQELVRHPQTFVYPNTIPSYPFPNKNRQFWLAFSGNLEYYPNVEAMKFFYRSAWQRLARRYPSLQWVVVGRGSQELRRRIRDSRVTFTGPVEDAVAWLARAAVAIVPVRVGSGTRVKILEAWAAATAVVSTSLGVEGLTFEHGKHGWIADTPQQMYEAICFLLGCPSRREQLALAGRHLYEQEYTWEAGWKRLAPLGL